MDEVDKPLDWSRPLWATPDVNSANQFRETLDLAKYLRLTLSKVDVTCALFIPSSKKAQGCPEALRDNEGYALTQTLHPLQILLDNFWSYPTFRALIVFSAVVIGKTTRVTLTHMQLFVQENHASRLDSNIAANGLTVLLSPQYWNTTSCSEP